MTVDTTRRSPAPPPQPGHLGGAGIDPDDLAICLRVLAEAETLPPSTRTRSPVRRATAGIFKSVKQRRAARSGGPRSAPPTRP